MSDSFVTAPIPKTKKKPTVAEAPTGELRILHTTDLHGQLHSYDYSQDRTGANCGLAHLTGVIQRQRSEVEQSLLFDTGDFLQGNLISAPEALNRVPANKRLLGDTPIVGLMNRIGYDGATLGNHEFGIGLSLLKGVLQEAEFPLVLSNLLRAEEEAALLTNLPQDLLLERPIICSDGIARTIRIGVVGLVPAQTPLWELPNHQHMLEFSPIIAAAHARSEALRQRGAAIVIVLAHTGIAAPGTGTPPDHSALEIAALEAVDVLLCGHQHRLFPAEDFDDLSGLNHSATQLKIDSRRGRLAGCPTTMAGSFGSHLGQIDLKLCYEQNRWHLTDSTSQLLPAEEPPVELKPLLAPYHKAARQHACTPLARIDKPLHSHFARFTNDRSVQLLARAQLATATELLQGRPEAALPLISAATSFRTGGATGLEQYLNVPAGQLEQRHLEGLYPHNDLFCLSRIAGRDLKVWLEANGRNFMQIQPGRPDQPLLDYSLPGYLFDHVIGISYAYDLTVPPAPPTAYAADHQMAPNAPSDRGRLQQLRWQGQEILDDQELIVAGNSFRLGGAGGIPGLSASRFVLPPTLPMREVLKRYLTAQNRNKVPPEPEDIWRILPITGTTVRVPTVVGALPYLEDISHLRPEVVPVVPQGQFALRLHL